MPTYCDLPKSSESNSDRSGRGPISSRPRPTWSNPLSLLMREKMRGNWPKVPQLFEPDVCLRHRGLKTALPWADLVWQTSAGETVLVSAARGRSRLCRSDRKAPWLFGSWAIAGGRKKMQMVTEEFGFDACIDYRAERGLGMIQALRAACPDGVDVYFGQRWLAPLLEAALLR